MTVKSGDKILTNDDVHACRRCFKELDKNDLAYARRNREDYRCRDCRLEHHRQSRLAKIEKEKIKEDSHLLFLKCRSCRYAVTYRMLKTARVGDEFCQQCGKRGNLMRT